MACYSDSFTLSYLLYIKISMLIEPSLPALRNGLPQFFLNILWYWSHGECSMQVTEIRVLFLVSCAHFRLLHPAVWPFPCFRYEGQTEPPSLLCRNCCTVCSLSARFCQPLVSVILRACLIIGLRSDAGLHTWRTWFVFRTYWFQVSNPGPEAVLTDSYRGYPQSLQEYWHSVSI
jgi:hypothetical protein